MNVKLIMSIDDGEELIYEIAKGQYVAIRGKGVRVINNWLNELRWHEYGEFVDDSYEKYGEGLRVIKDNEKTIREQIRRWREPDKKITDWQDELKYRAKKGQKIMY